MNNPNNMPGLPFCGGMVVAEPGQNPVSPMKTEKVCSAGGATIQVTTFYYLRLSATQNTLSELVKSLCLASCSNEIPSAWLCGGCVVFNATFVRSQTTIKK